MKDIEIGFILLAEAEKGSVNAMVDWATWRSVFNSDTELTDEEAERVIKYYTKGVENDIPTACLNLGAMYYNGEYVKRDYNMAAELYKKAAELGDMQALCNLGYCYYYGRISEPDYKKAYDCFNKSALVSNNCNSLYKLGDMYANGYYVEKDENLAFLLYQKASDNIEENDPNFLEADIYYRLGECLLKGTGCDKNILSAYEHLSKASVAMYKKIAAKINYSSETFKKILILLEEAKSSLNEKYIDGFWNNVM